MPCTTGESCYKYIRLYASIYGWSMRKLTRAMNSTYKNKILKLNSRQLKRELSKEGFFKLYLHYADTLLHK